MRLSFCLWVLVVGVLLSVNAVAEEFNPIVGKAGEFVLREADLERLISYQPPEIQQSLAEPARRDAFVRQILVAKAAAARAKKDAFDRKPEIKEQLSYLVDNYLAQEYVRKVVLANIAVPEEDMRSYYKEHQEEFLLPQEATARHIFFQLPDDPSPEVKKQVREKVEQALLKLEQGEDFERLAREISEDADTAAKGGSLGVISPGKTNSKEFEDALFALKKGETSSVVETPFGFHIIKVEDRKEQRTATFEEARAYIQNILKGQAEQKKAQEFLDLVAKESGVTVPNETQTLGDDKGAQGK